LNLIKDSDKLITGKIKTIIGDSIKTPDDNTVIITLNKKAAYFLDALTYSCSYVVEKSLVDKYGANFTDHLDAGGTSGPWKVQSYDHTKGITFVPNTYYYGPKPQLAKVIMPFYKDNVTAYKAYKVNQIDWSSVPSSNIAEAKTLTNEFRQSPELTIFYIGMNYLAKPFDNIKIRQAFELAINKDAISKSVWKGRYVATNHIVPQGMPGYNPGLKGPDGTTSTAGNPNMAKQLFMQGLKEDGFASVSALPTITYSYQANNSDAANEVAVEAQEWQNVLGVTVKTEAVDFNKLIEEEFASSNNAKGLQIYGAGWGADYPDPQDFLTLQFDKNATNNNSNYGQNNSSAAAEQQAVQKVLEKADVNSNSAARLQQYMDSEQKMVNDVAWLPTFQRTQTHVIKTYVHNFPSNAETMVAPDSWKDIYITAH
jgi:peptide/nickel transport system substrate-binding protein/oligopeptide transport system substrate-binding protein